MAKVTFKSYDPNDNLLLPPCLGDYLPENHNARVVGAIIDRLDISEIERGYKGGGASSYNPRMLLKVISLRLPEQHIFGPPHGEAAGGEHRVHVARRHAAA